MANDEPTPADEQPTSADVPAEPASRSRRRKAAASSAGSSAAAEPFFTDPGSFDADQAGDEPDEPDPGLPVEPVLWTPERIRRVLELQGKLTHSLVGVAERDWVWLPDELDLVCGPLAEHANRVPALAALATLSDDAAIAAGFFTYLSRSWIERTRELRARQQAPRPVTGHAPAPEPQPTQEEQWEIS